MMVDRELVQAVSDWQRGGSHDQKIKRGQRLKAVAAKLPETFRVCSDPCFRQEAHEKDRVWQLLADNQLPETIASWTNDIGVAKTLKGGVPATGLQGVILKIKPPKNSVILNLTALNADPAFQAAVETHKASIDGYYDGPRLVDKKPPRENAAFSFHGNLNISDRRGGIHT